MSNTSEGAYVRIYSRKELMVALVLHMNDEMVTEILMREDAKFVLENMGVEENDK